MSNDLIVKHNSVIVASYKITANEQRVINSILAKIPKGEEVAHDKIYYIKPSCLSEFGVHKKTAYRDLKEAVNLLYNRSISSINSSEKTITDVRWLQAKVRPFETSENDDHVAFGIMFSSIITPYLTNLTGDFAKIKKDEMCMLSSFYAMRVFDLLMQAQKSGYRKIEITTFRTMFDLQEKYKKTTDLKRYIIDKACEEIAEKTPYKVTYNLVRQGRRYKWIEFFFEKKDKKKDKNKALENKSGKCSKTADMFKQNGLSLDVAKQYVDQLVGEFSKWKGTREQQKERLIEELQNGEFCEKNKLILLRFGVPYKQK